MFDCLQATLDASIAGEEESRKTMAAALTARAALVQEATALRAAGDQLVGECNTWAAQHTHILGLVG